MPKAWTFGENMNTDEIIPGRYNITIDPLELAKNVFCEVKPEYAKTAKPGDIIVGRQNFGCGSSREHAPIAIKGSQAKCIIAPSFARIFFRNAINIGLLVIESPEHEIQNGSQVTIDIENGFIESDGKKYRATKMPDVMLKILNAGGLVNFLNQTGGYE